MKQSKKLCTKIVMKMIKIVICNKNRKIKEVKKLTQVNWNTSMKTGCKTDKTTKMKKG